MRFLDTNVLLRFLTRDDPVKADAARELLRRVDAGDEELLTSETVIGEIFYVLTRGRGGYRVDRVDLAGSVKAIVSARGISLPDKTAVLRALDIYAAFSFLDFEDALSVAHMEAHGITELYSYDRGFDQVAGVTRLEP